ncbi:hypothetical protein [Streptomyces sp. NPDC059991]|uniref:hypothetical protein n=1 Tax=unclassified Streptomyces TaxID=2593676 RepID=UPI003677AC10
MPSSRGSAVAATAFPVASRPARTRSPVTRVTVTCRPCCRAAASPPVIGLYAVAAAGGAATDGERAVTARAAAVATPRAVRDIGRIALPR